MDKDQFLHIRQGLRKTQKQIAALLGVSLKAVHSYEQGRRPVPAHVERHMLLMAARMSGDSGVQEPCWITKQCPPERKERCPAWEFQAGSLCWFFNGTICGGVVHENWNEKMKICRSCEVFQRNIHLPALFQPTPIH